MIKVSRAYLLLVSFTSSLVAVTAGASVASLAAAVVGALVGAVSSQKTL